jgi:hypothetical protein
VIVWRLAPYRWPSPRPTGEITVLETAPSQAAAAHGGSPGPLPYLTGATIRMSRRMSTAGSQVFWLVRIAMEIPGPRR